MEPHLFRRHLRKIVANTARATAIAGTAFAVSCSINIISGPKEAFRPDTGTSMSDRVLIPGDDTQVKDDPNGDTSPPKPDVTKPPPDVTKPPPDVTNPPPDFTKYVPTDSCPMEPACRASDVFKGVYHKLLTGAEPSPLSLKECLALCQQDMGSICPSVSLRDGEQQVYFSVTPKDCKEDRDEQKRRMLICDYELRQSCAVAGRRPAGLEEQVMATKHFQSPEEEAGAFFAELAYLEDAAVTAFQYLVKELKAYNAPDALVDLATQAIQEEREHVVLMTALAARYGATPVAAKAAPFVLRPLAEIAIENAREGCIRESFGSVLGFWQAGASEDPAVRAVMERIAHEESNHGALSWAIDEWLRPQLPAEARAAYEEAHQQAIAEIQAEILDEPTEAMRRYVGFPSAQQAQHLFQQLTNA